MSTEEQKKLPEDDHKEEEIPLEDHDPKVIHHTYPLKLSRTYLQPSTLYTLAFFTNQFILFYIAIRIKDQDKVNKSYMIFQALRPKCLRKETREQ